MFKKLKSWILPKEIDFFESLSGQGRATYSVIHELCNYYSKNDSEGQELLFARIDDAKNLRKINLKELNSTFITPVDKESISRAYTSLHWIALSAKHLVVEMNTYQIFSLKNYPKLLEFLQLEMHELTMGFNLLKDKEYNQILKKVNEVIHYDNEIIQEYARLLNDLFTETNLNVVLKHKEILSQIKEISKRIHFCSNLLEDLVFKMN